MSFWEVFDYIYGMMLFLAVAYFSIMSAFLPKPKYIYDEDDNDKAD